QLARAQKVAARAWEDSTKRSYGTGLSCWAEWCDINGIPEDEQMPIDSVLLACFAANAAGSIGISGFDNWFSGLQAWHVYHNMQWNGGDEYVQLILSGVRKLAPSSSTHDPRPPVQLAHLEAIYDVLDFLNSYDAACWAVVCTAFWGVAQLGEVTV
ncbi:hypothetical protein BS47DRAFT_1257442, partial [Hydnum rufescens UP504]